MFPPTPTLIPPSPSHSKWTHNCRSSGETVTNCRESPIYDVSSDHPFGHLFRGEILKILNSLFTKLERGTSQKPGALFYYPRGWTGHILRALSIIQLWKFCDSKNLIDYNSPNFERRSLAVHCFTISEAELATFYDHCTSFNTAVYGRCISPTLNCLTLECVTKPIHL